MILRISECHYVQSTRFTSLQRCSRAHFYGTAPVFHQNKLSEMYLSLFLYPFLSIFLYQNSLSFPFAASASFSVSVSRSTHSLSFPLVYLTPSSTSFSAATATAAAAAANPEQQQKQGTSKQLFFRQKQLQINLFFSIVSTSCFAG